MTAAPASTSDLLPVLLPGVPVLVRGDSGVHVGCDPRTAVVLRLGAGQDPQAVAAVLASLRTPSAYRQVSRRVRSAGLNARSFRAMLDRLVAEGKAVRAATPTRFGRLTGALRVDVHGHGDFAAGVTAALAAAGHDVRGTTDGPRRSALVIIADQPIPDPALVHRLMAEAVPHLQVHLRDGVGVVGPLVLPGSTSCLRCVDLTRCDLDPQWPTLAARLSGVAGYASDSVARTTAAIACAHVEEITALLRAGSTRRPSLVNQTIEFRSAPPRLDRVEAPVHPRCRCTRTAFTDD